MEPDDELCLCFHVTKRKVVNFIRVCRPQTATQLSNCYGAGTGCGWCRPYLKALFEQARDHTSDAPLPSAPEYAACRHEYLQQKKNDL